MDTSQLLPETFLDHAVRKSGITATDIAKILGLSSYGSAWDVYASKAGLITSKFEENEAMELGTLLQLPVVHMYQKATGNPIKWLDRTVRHPDYPWAVATPDGEQAQLRIDGKRGGYEGKTAGGAQVWKWGPSWSDKMPEDYRAQCEWNCFVNGWDFCDLAVLLGAESLQCRYYRIEPTPERLAFLRDTAKAFWFDHVVARVPPPITATNLAAEFLRGIPQSSDFRMATGEELDLLEEYLTLKASAGPNIERLEDLETQIKAAIGLHTGITWDGGGKATWKQSKSSIKPDWEAIARASGALLMEGAFEAIVAENTKEKPGSRRLLVKKGKG